MLLSSGPQETHPLDTSKEAIFRNLDKTLQHLAAVDAAVVMQDLANEIKPSSDVTAETMETGDTPAPLQTLE